MGWVEHDYADAATLLEEVAGSFETACRDAIAQRGDARLALAGGRTPLPIYAHLANANVDGRILAIPTDERCVPHDHPACNLRNLREAFAPARHSREGGNPAFDLSRQQQELDSRLRGNDEPGNIVAHPITATNGDIDASLAQARALLASHPEPFDAVLLGMGADGHIASLFPGAANLRDGLALASGLDAIATQPDPLPPEAPYARISLTLPRLLRARAIHLVVTGQVKRAILRRAQQDAQAPYPVAALLHAAASPIHIHWSP
ncbi:6-phosphogluconolactonase [Thermomonas paludicola]|uniref:6-phosphogluconolactonase n=1 Tax=Thermomonas paludicola TaxID=2884874 RepID=UPI002113AC46|nr:6-phosphogluconolactonase [Thermomonas paludicola]